MWFWILPAALASESVAPTRLQDPIIVDGVLDEAAWDAVPWVEGFTTFSPANGAPDDRARARIAYDETALYVAFDIQRNPDFPLSKTLVSRDHTLFHDWVGVTLDTYGDAQRAAVFRSTPSGVQADGVFIEGEHIWMHSLSWDAVFESAGVANDDGYTVEMAIPFRSLRYGKDESQQWGIILSHFAPKPWTINAWPPMTRETAGILQQAAHLGPIEPPPPKMHVELQPTLVGAAEMGATKSERRQAGDPFWYDLQPDEPEWSMAPGISGRVGLTSALTADFAVNPDFSQIEADAEKVEANVKYPLFYEEKRPFFLEGADLYDAVIPILYSRSVANPMVGYKLTGRSGGWSFGGLGALDQSPTESTISLDYASGETRPGWDSDTVAGRPSLVHMGRVQREMDRGRSVGILVSDKELLGGASTLGNRVGAVDGAMQVGEQIRVYGLGLYSQTDLKEGKTLAGPAWSVMASRSGQVLGVEMEQYGVSEGFRAENGFLRDVGRLGTRADVKLHLADVGPARFLGPGLKSNAEWDLEGQLVSAQAGPKLEAMIGGGFYTRTGIIYERERYLGEDFDLWRFRGYASLDPTPYTDLGIGWRIGPQPHYDAADEGDLYRGFSWRGELSLDQELFGRWILTYNLLAERFGQTWDSNAVYATVLHRFHTSFYLSRELGLRWITDFNQSDDILATSALFSYQLNHGTAVYLGGTASTALETSDPADLSVFAKLSWLYRP